MALKKTTAYAPRSAPRFKMCRDFSTSPFIPPDHPLEILLVNRVVAREDHHGLVAGDGHDRSVLLAGSSHVGDEGVAQVVEPEVLNPGLLTSSLEGRLD